MKRDAGKRKDGLVVTTIALTAEQLAQLDEIAARDHRTRSSLFRVMVDRELAAHAAGRSAERAGR